MGITNMEISTTFLIIIIRTNHGQTEIVMQYGGLRSSVTCVTTYCSNDSFASPINRCIKACGCCSTRAQVRQTVPVVCPVEFDGDEHVYRVHSINVQLVTDLVIMTAKKEHGCDFAVAERVER